MLPIGFDNDKYLSKQSERIKERISQFGDKLYLEFGGKLFDDYHASRVLPGFQPDSKLKMLMQLKDCCEIIIAISAYDIENNKKHGDIGIAYDEDVLRLRDVFMEKGLQVSSVVITHFTGQVSSVSYRKRLEHFGINVYYHYLIDGYPANVTLIDSEEGFGKNDYVPTTRPLVVVTAPGPGSGKMAVCLSQLYHERNRGIKAGYAKFETFPVWNLPLKHPVNMAYEAATADLNDINMIDPFHLDAYGVTAVNYNRDIEIYPVLNSIFESIYGDSPYKSPTDMGVNMSGYCISDDEVCSEAAKQEIIRRYYDALCRYVDGRGSDMEINKISLLMKQAKITTDYRKVTVAAKQREAEGGQYAAAIELADGTIITAEQSPLLGAVSALILNATKYLAGIDHAVKLIPAYMIEPIQKMKVSYLHGTNPRLHTDETLVALSILSTSDLSCKKCLEHLPDFRGCQMHTTSMLSEVDQKVLKKLGVSYTSEPIKKKNSNLKKYSW